jgi:prepilin-type N-terminal cleavage/methylation domain-containing protein
MNKKEKGFTLIEIAIVIVIIGLLAGGVSEQS